MKESITLSEEGKALTIETEYEGETYSFPADFSFNTVNDYVHDSDITYEELVCLCLGMATYFDEINKQNFHLETKK